jgi:threonylcarbamoyladenosine tRNA methylthiotransferase MtaB
VKVYLDSIGCRLNQAEIERYAYQFDAAGVSIVSSPDEASLALINTCAVTDAAVSDSRQKIRRLARSGVEQIIVTGCWATLEAVEAATLPAVCRVVPNQEKDELVTDFLADHAMKGSSNNTFPQEASRSALGKKEACLQPDPSPRLRTRAFIKAQDGCDNRCTFCISVLARGSSHSRSIDEILHDIEAASDAKEVVLTGLHLGSWGQDFSPALRLRHLVQAILDRTEIPRLRLSSLEPWELDIELIELWKNRRLCQHFHLPLQSGCSATLRRMARKTTPETYSKQVAAVRTIVPEAAITTDIITGFPGESEVEFQESLDFVRSMNFAGGHVFTYSARPGTLAARMTDQVPYPIRKSRNSLVQTVFREAARSYRVSFIDRVLPVLWESAASSNQGRFRLSGLTSNYIRVNACSYCNMWNQITPVHLDTLVDGHIEGSITV